ncbi:MAG: hypothetical protein ACFFBR_01765 [Promethearchaeota archaeon]
MSRRQRKGKKQRQKRLEKVPEKLQRKRDRPERQKPRRMPGWVRIGLVVILIAVIIGGSTWAYLNLLPEPEPTQPVQGALYILQQDTFFVFINESGHVEIDFMISRYAGGTFGGNQPLNLTFSRTFDDDVNFTLIDPHVFYDYYGNAYYIPPETDANSISYVVENIHPNMQFEYERRNFRGHSTMSGYYNLLWDYMLNSSDNVWLQTDTMEDMYTFTLDIRPENDTIPYNTPTIVHCNITFNTLQVADANTYNWGESMLIFPKNVYNGTMLLANMTVHEVLRIGSLVNPPLNPTIDNETHIGFEANPITTSMSQNQSWGYTFDLNVTSFTNSSFCLIDLTTPKNEFFMQSGYTGIVEEQPMHFPKAEIEILTPYQTQQKKNYTDIIFRFPEICVDNGTIFYNLPPDAFGPRTLSIIQPASQEPTSQSVPSLVRIFEISSDMCIQVISWFTDLWRQFVFG